MKDFKEAPAVNTTDSLIKGSVTTPPFIEEKVEDFVRTFKHYDDDENDWLRTALTEAYERGEKDEAERIIEIVQSVSEPFMVPETEARFIRDVINKDV